MREPGVHRTELTFSHAALDGWRWPAVDLVGRDAGPRLAIVAGIHVNETSSIEAAIRLQAAIDPSTLKGRISILPVVNLPAVAVRAQYVCPLDGKNINFSFPGRPDGTFSEAIAWALLDDWAADADCFVDLHGGDLCENVSHFTVAQMRGEPEFDAYNLKLAQCFDAELIVRLDPSHLEDPGRSCTGRAGRRQHAAFAEAGRIGLIEEANVTLHLEGVLRIAALMGMIPEAPPKRRAAVLVDRYIWVAAPVDGFYRYRTQAGQKVSAGTVLATAENTYGDVIAHVTAPAAGRILWTLTHAFVNEGELVMGLGAASSDA
jgi:hypothetical protein